MGMLRLRDFRRLVSTALGDAGIGNELLDLWINMGYVDVMTRFRHKNLLVRATIPTEIGVEKYPLPCDLLGIDSIQIVESDKTLIRGEPRNIRGHKRTRDAWAEPRIYTRVGEELDIWPTPDRVYTMEMWFFQEAPKLEEPDDQTKFPSTLDPLIFYYSAYHAMTNLGRPEERCMLWMERAERYWSTREDDDDFGSGDVTAPLNVATSFEDLHRNPRFGVRSE